MASLLAYGIHNFKAGNQINFAPILYFLSYLAIPSLEMGQLMVLLVKVCNHNFGRGGGGGGEVLCVVTKWTDSK